MFILKEIHMFKSIRWKITLLFILTVAASEILIGAAGMIFTSRYFRTDFKDTINSALSSGLRAQLNTAANSVTIPAPAADGSPIIMEETSSINLEGIRDTMNSYLGRLAMSASRTYSVLDGKSAKVLYSSVSGTEVVMTPVLQAAINGTESFETGMMAKYMDYALPLGSPGNTKFIVYIHDTKAVQNNVMYGIAVIWLYILAASVVIAFIIATLLSRSITVPIRRLTVQAKKLADGDLKALQESSAGDELGDLTNSLLYLAHSRKESNEKAKGEQIKVETILQNMNDGILAFNMQGNLIHVNPEAQKLLNRKYLDDIRFDSFFKEINAGITLGDLLYMKPDGSVEREIKLDNTYLRMNFATFNTENKVGGIIVIIHDITHQEKLEQSRRDFVADVSHELRTPLTTIKSYSETLSDMPNADRELQVRFLDVIASEADRMARIISDLLTLSELDENQTLYKVPETIDIRKALETIVERMGMTAKKKQQTLIYHPINEVPQISGDRDGLERVIINIISNAVKYTPTGGRIEVYSSRVYNDICIKVSDNGIGIPKDKLPNIFDRFYRVDKARSRDTGGTGLGLAIAKQTLESCFNGKIKINSEINKGTEVTITIPVPEGQ